MFDVNSWYWNKTKILLYFAFIKGLIWKILDINKEQLIYVMKIEGKEKEESVGEAA